MVKPEPPVKIKPEKSWAVQTIQLQAGAKTPQLELYGRVESPYNATITSTITADVLSLDVKEGDVINQGQLLMTLDSSEVKLILDQRLSDVNELVAQIQLEKNRHKNDIASLKIEKSLASLAEKKLAREAKTSKENLTSRSSFDTQKQALQNQKLSLKARQLSVADHPSRLAQLNARLKQKKSVVEQAEKDFQRANIFSPFDGIILNTNVAPGERVRLGETLLEIYSTENVELRAQLPQKYLSRIKQALAQDHIIQGILKTDDENNNITTLILHRISGAIADTGTGVDALFEVNTNNTDSLIMGEVLELTIDLPMIENVYRVPLSSIYGSNRVYRVKEDRLQSINIKKFGSQFIKGNQYFLIRSDELQTGDNIIITQLPRAISGLKVEIRNTQSRQ